MFSLGLWVAVVIGYLAGYAIGGLVIAVVVAALFVALYILATRRTKRADVGVGAAAALPATSSMQRSCELERLKTKFGDLRAPPLRFRLLCAWFGILALPIVYDIVLVVAYSSGAVNGWLQTFQPAVDWLGEYVPAIRRTPGEFAAIGQSDWAPLVQHAMSVSWVVTALIMIWMLLDIWFLHPSMWTDPAVSRFKELVWGTIGGGVVTALVFLRLFFGHKPSSWRDAFVGAGLPGIGIVFFFSMFFFLMFIVGIVALIRSISYRHARRREFEDERASRSEMPATLRRALTSPRKNRDQNGESDERHRNDPAAI
jgi:hypothetical protein